MSWVRIPLGTLKGSWKASFFCTVGWEPIGFVIDEVAEPWRRIPLGTLKRPTNNSRSLFYYGYSKNRGDRVSLAQRKKSVDGQLLLPAQSRQSSPLAELRRLFWGACSRFCMRRCIVWETWWHLDKKSRDSLLRCASFYNTRTAAGEIRQPAAQKGCASYAQGLAPPSCAWPTQSFQPTFSFDPKCTSKKMTRRQQ